MCLFLYTASIFQAVIGNIAQVLAIGAFAIALGAFQQFAAVDPAVFIGDFFRGGDLDALALFECSVTAELPAGDHVLTLGRVLWGELRDPSMEPLIYRDTGNLDGAAAIFPDDFE